MRGLILLLTASTLLLASCTREESSTGQTRATPTLTATTNSQSPWVKNRVSAFEQVYNITPDGRRWLNGYDFRQMAGQPGWFGSYGNKQWAGAGQANFQSVAHELGHSYWGAFPITGYESLSWDVSEGSLSPALKQYRADLEAFMRQPPDGFEPLRERFRNMPNLSKGDYPDLFHHGEADLVHTVAGNLELLPPILRKYFNRHLSQGQLSSWYHAISRYKGLSDDDKRWADQYFGVTHFPLDSYDSLPKESTASVPSKTRDILAGEEKQRLIDFAQQYDLIKANELSFTDAASVDRGFQFWRDYLRDKLDLHKKYPDVLTGSKEAKAPVLKAALDAIVEGSKLTEDSQAAFYSDRFTRDPFLKDFAVLLPSRVLVTLFGQSELASGSQPVEGIVTRYTQKLVAYIKAIDAVLAAGKADPVQGAQRLEQFFAGLTDQQQSANLSLIMDLLREADASTTKNVVNGMSTDALLRAYRNQPSSIMNGTVAPQRLLDALNIRADKSQAEIVKGISTFLEHSSGNFKIDEPFILLTYDLIADIGRTDHKNALQIFEETRLPLLRFVQKHPTDARAILLQDTGRAARLIASVQGFENTPQGVIYGIINVDPDLAASLVKALHTQGQASIVAESTIFFAFDASRIQTVPSIKLSLEKDGVFLERLHDSLGKDTLQNYMAQAIGQYQQEVRDVKIDPTFIEEYRRTLKAILAFEKDAQKRAA